MKKVIIKGSEISNIEDLHKFLKKEMEFPNHYGENLDALWDCIEGEIELPVFVYWENFEESKRKIGNVVCEYVNLFEEASNELEGFKFEIGYIPDGA